MDVVLFLSLISEGFEPHTVITYPSVHHFYIFLLLEVQKIHNLDILICSEKLSMKNTAVILIKFQFYNLVCFGSPMDSWSYSVNFFPFLKNIYFSLQSSLSLLKHTNHKYDIRVHLL